VPNLTYYSDLLIPLPPFDSSENLFTSVKGNHVDHSMYALIWQQAHHILSCNPQKNNPSGFPFLSILSFFWWPFLFLWIVATKHDYHGRKTPQFLYLKPVYKWDIHSVTELTNVECWVPAIFWALWNAEGNKKWNAPYFMTMNNGGYYINKQKLIDTSKQENKYLICGSEV
jgi:hypothetical protein